MGKAVIIITIVLVILVMFGGLLAYSYTQIHVNLDDVDFHSIDWMEISFSKLLSLGINTLSGNVPGVMFDLIDGINLNLIFGLTNNGFLPVYIPDITYDLSLNGIHVGQGKSVIDTTINPGQTKQITSFQNFKKSNLAPAASAIIADGGIIDLKVSGTAYFKLFGLNIPIPFESSKQISIMDELKKKINKIYEQNKKQTTRITLSISDSAVYEGSVVYINGKLMTSDGRTLSNAFIYIKDEDSGSGDDTIKTLTTDSGGNFGINWIAKSMDPFDDTVEIYAVFEGNQEFESSRSPQFDLYVSEYTQQDEYTQQEFATQETQRQSEPIFSQTSLSLVSSHTTIDEGYILIISGKLVDSQGYVLQNGIIYIKDEDSGSGDDDIVTLYTNEDGEFYYEWVADTMDPFDNVVELYAVFEGTTNFGSSRSAQIDILIK